MQLQAELREPLAKIREELLRVRLMLEPGNEVVREAHDDDITVRGVLTTGPTSQRHSGGRRSPVTAMPMRLVAPVPLEYSIGWVTCTVAGMMDAVTVGLRVLLKIVYLLTCRVLGLVVLVFRGDRAKDAELLVLRHENAVL